MLAPPTQALRVPEPDRLCSDPCVRRELVCLAPKRDIILNELVQGLRPMSQGIEWFDTRGPEE